MQLQISPNRPKFLICLFNKKAGKSGIAAKFSGF